MTMIYIAQVPFAHALLVNTGRVCHLLTGAVTVIELHFAIIWGSF